MQEITIKYFNYKELKENMRIDIDTLKGYNIKFKVDLSKTEIIIPTLKIKLIYKSIEQGRKVFFGRRNITNYNVNLIKEIIERKGVDFLKKYC